MPFSCRGEWMDRRSRMNLAHPLAVRPPRRRPNLVPPGHNAQLPPSGIASRRVDHQVFNPRSTALPSTSGEEFGRQLG